jgi:hypothetical protein
VGAGKTIPRTDDYNERNDAFTGQTDNVTVERKGCSIARGHEAAPG